MRIPGIFLSEYKQIKVGTLMKGDVVFVKNSLGGKTLYEIDRTTKTQAVCDNVKFSINVSNVHFVPAEMWDTNQYIVFRKR